MKQAMTPRCPGIDAADPSPIDDRGLIGAAGIPPGDRSAGCAVCRTYRRLGPAPGRRAAGVHMRAPVAHGVSARAMRAPGYRMDGTDARPYHDAGILRPGGRAGPRQSGGLTRPAKLEPPRMAPGSRLRRREAGAGSQPPAMPDMARYGSRRPCAVSCIASAMGCGAAAGRLQRTPSGSPVVCRDRARPPDEITLPRGGPASATSSSRRAASPGAHGSSPGERDDQRISRQPRERPERALARTRRRAPRPRRHPPPAAGSTPDPTPARAAGPDARRPPRWPRCSPDGAAP